MIERTIHFATPPKRTELMERAIAVAREMHPGWEVRVWSDDAQDPGFRLFNAYRDRCRSGAQRADLLRLDVLNVQGGFYLDSDVILQRPLDDLLALGDFLVCTEEGRNLTNAVVAACRGHPAIASLVEELAAREPDWSVPPNITTGPVFFTRHLQWNRDITVLPREAFYPYHYDEPEFVHRKSHGVHMWAGSWLAAKPDVRTRAVDGVVFAGEQSHAPGLRPWVKKQVRRAWSLWRRIEALDADRQRVYPAYSASDQVIATTAHGHRVVLDGYDISITPAVVGNGYYEREEEQFVAACLRGGDWFVDVGANVGLFTLLAASRVGPCGRVFAYEPGGRPRGLLARSLVMNWFHDRVLLRPAAVGAARSETELLSVPGVAGGARVSSTDLDAAAVTGVSSVLGEAVRERVPVVALDDEFPVDLPIKLLKIDVEGFEADVLKGCRRLTANRCLDYILLEMTPEIAGCQWWPMVDEVRRVIESGYQPCRIEAEGILRRYSSLDAALADRRRGRNLVLAAV